MSDLSQYSDEQLQTALQNPQAGSQIKRKIRQELNKRSPSQKRDVLTNAPVGDAPNWMVNLAPSAMQYGQDLIQGTANMITDPVGTASNLIPGMMQHYGSRYSSPQQAISTFSQDPVGVMADIAPLGGAMNLAGRAARSPMISGAGRALERADPLTQLMGAGQMAIGAAENALPFVPSPTESMAGTYGQPRGRQRENLPEYLETIGQAMDQDFPATVQGAESAKKAKSEIGQQLEDLMSSRELEGVSGSRQMLVRRLIDLQRQANTEVDAPYRSAIDKMIDDLMKSDVDTISLTEMQRLKERYAGLVNYDSATPPVDRLTQEGYDAAAGVLREELRAVPGMRSLYDQYGQAAKVQDIVQRGAAKDISGGGSGLGKYISFGGVIDATAPVLTSQGKLKRNQIRRDLGRGNLIDAYMGATDPSYANRMRQGALVSEMSGNVDDQWHVGRLWED